jgi:hypothetical protein
MPYGPIPCICYESCELIHLTMPGSCKHGYKLLGSINARHFLTTGQFSRSQHGLKVNLAEPSDLTLSAVMNFEY